MFREVLLFPRPMAPADSEAAAADSSFPDTLQIGYVTLRPSNLLTPLSQRSRMLLNRALGAETVRQPVDKQVDDDGLFTYTFCAADGETMLATCAMDHHGYLMQIVITDGQGRQLCDARMKTTLR